MDLRQENELLVASLVGGVQKRAQNPLGKTITNTNSDAINTENTIVNTVANAGRP